MQRDSYPNDFFSRFRASIIFVILARISSSDARDHRSLASAEAAAFFLRRFRGPHLARAALRARAERSAALKAFLLSCHRTASHHYPADRNSAGRAHVMLRCSTVLECRAHVMHKMGCLHCFPRAFRRVRPAKPTGKAAARP